MRWVCVSLRLPSLIIAKSTKLLDWSRIDYTTYAKNRVLADQLDLRVGDGTLRVALTIGLDVSEVTNVTVIITGATVTLAEGVDYIVLLAAFSCSMA